MPNEIFTPEHKSINDVFVRDVKYIIPAYQRPYSWESIGKSDANDQINNMWDDFYDFYLKNNEEQEYFFGSIVVYKEKEGFQVVDGQQRLTSLLLLFAAMKCFLIECEKIVEPENEKPLVDFIQDAIRTIDDTLYNKESLSLNSILKVKIQRVGSQNFDKFLNDSVSCKDKTTINQIEDKNRIIGERYFNNRDFFVEQLKKIFLENEQLTLEKAKAFDQFWAFLRTRISIVFIQTTNFETAYNIFEVLNNRGLPLTNLDLFKNFFLNELGKGAEEKWDYLEKSYHLSSDFLGRFIESKNGSQLRKSAFNEIKSYYGNLRVVGNKPEIFYAELENDLKYFTMITHENNITDQQIKYEVKFAKLLGHERYTTNYLMAVFRAFQYDGLKNQELLAHIKKYVKMRLYILLAPGKRFSSSPIYRAIKELNNDKLNHQAYQKSKVHLELQKEESDELKKLISGEIKDNDIAKVLIAKYIFESYVEDDLVEQELIFDKATLEHIIPQKPEKDSDWIKDFDSKFRTRYTYKIGNFTLLTTKINSKAKNYSFSRKKLEYEKTNLSITRDLAQLGRITPKYVEQRHKKIVERLLNSLGI